MQWKKTLDLLEALEYIDPAALSYQEWLAVGMGLKEAGYAASVWEDWSRSDGKRYHPEECQKKWNGFHGNSNPITAGTIVSMARSRGWRPARSGGREMGWDDVIGTDGEDSRIVVDRNWVEDREVAEPEEWQPAQQLIRYLEALFDADDNVGYVTRSFEKEGRHLPSKGCFDRTAGRLIQELTRCGGMWVRYWGTATNRRAPGSASTPWTARGSKTRTSPTSGMLWWSRTHCPLRSRTPSSGSWSCRWRRWYTPGEKVSMLSSALRRAAMRSTGGGWITCTACASATVWRLTDRTATRPGLAECPALCEMGASSSWWTPTSERHPGMSGRSGSRASATICRILRIWPTPGTICPSWRRR